MGYEFTCDDCGHPGEAPALMGQFSERVWMTTELGDRLKSHGYELGDTVTLCEDCTLELLR